MGGAPQPFFFRAGQAADGTARMDAGLPEDLIGQQVADPGDPVLVQQPGLDRRGRACAQGRPELGRRDPLRVRAQLVHRRVQPDTAQPTGVDQHQPAPVGEEQREPGPAVVTGPALALPVVAAVDLGPAGVGDHDLARHPEVDPQCDRAGHPADLAPHALALPPGVHQLTAEQRLPDRPRRMRAAHEPVGVVDVSDATPQPGPFDDHPRRFDLRKLRHRTTLLNEGLSGLGPAGHWGPVATGRSGSVIQCDHDPG
ncbi:MAG TPA: hypothetical protein VGG50_00370 [Streptosporangiaceae bacterium]